MKRAAEDAIKPYCQCERPIRHDVQTGGGELVATMCGLCVRQLEYRCQGCKKMTRSSEREAHDKEFHPPEKKPRVKKRREPLTPLEQYLQEKK